MVYIEGDCVGIFVVVAISVVVFFFLEDGFCTQERQQGYKYVGYRK